MAADASAGWRAGRMAGLFAARVSMHSGRSSPRHFCLLLHLLMLTRLLDGSAFASWPFFETCVSEANKPSKHCLDLGTEAAIAQLAKYDGRTKPDSELAKGGTYQNAVTKGALEAFGGKRKPPMVPSAFEIELTDKTFTNGADEDLVCSLQKEVVETVLGESRALDFSGLGWGVLDMKKLRVALYLCTRLETLVSASPPLRD